MKSLELYIDKNDSWYMIIQDNIYTDWVHVQSDITMNRLNKYYNLNNDINQLSGKLIKLLEYE